MITLDKDFGELAYRQGKTVSSGVILIRPKRKSPDAIQKLILSVLGMNVDFAGRFAVATEAGLRSIPLP